MAIDSPGVQFPGYPRHVVETPGYSVEVIKGTLGTFAVGGWTTTTTVQDVDQPGVFTTPCPQWNGDFTVYPDDGLAPVVEYYHPELDHYFMTQDAIEIADLDAGVHRGWIRTGQSFRAYRPGQGGGPRVSRYYGLPSAGLNTHFFANDLSNIFFLTVGPRARDWVLESNNAFELDFTSTGNCSPGGIPLYRLWNQRIDSNHRYTTDATIKAEMVAKGMAAHSTPVPHPTSSHRRPAGTFNQDRNKGATRRLQRPRYRS